MKIFSMFGEIFVKTDKAINGLKTTDEQLAMVQNGMKKASKVIAIGMATATTAVVGLATKTAAAADTVDKLSQKIGFSREGFQEWDFILSQNGANIESLQGGMKTLTGAIFEAGQGTSTYVDALAGLNLSYENLAGLTPEEQFETVFAALQNVTDESTRAALASDLLGRSASELAPALNAGSEAIEEQRQQAHDLSTIMSDEVVDAGVQLTDSLDQLKKMGSSLMAEFLVPVINIVNTVIQGLISFRDWAEQNRTTLQVLAILIGTITALIIAYNVQQALATAGMTLWQAAAAIGTTVTTALGAAFTFLTSPIALVILAIGAVIAITVLLVKNWDKVKETLKKTWNGTKQTAIKVFTAIKDFFIKQKDAIVKIFTDIKEFFGNVWDAIKEKFTTIIDGIKEIFTGMIDSAKTWGKDMIQGFIDGIKAMIQKVKDTVTNIANTVKDFLGFSVPDKGPLSDADEYGSDFIDLFTEKMKASKNKLIADVQGIAATISGNFNPTSSQLATANGAPTINQEVNFYSDRPLDPLEAKRQTKKAANDLAFEWSNS